LQFFIEDKSVGVDAWKEIKLNTIYQSKKDHERLNTVQEYMSKSEL
jgi:hypothetical protein